MPRLLLQTALMLALLASFGLAACNTAEGVGEDVQATGNALENTAKDVKQEL